MLAAFASHLLNTKEEPLEEVRRALGHSSPTSIQYITREKRVSWEPDFQDGVLKISGSFYVQLTMIG